MKSLGKVSAGVAGGIGASWAASKVGQFAKDSMQQFENLGATTLKLQRYMGGSAEDASRLAHAFAMTGIDSDAATKSLGIFSKGLSGGSKAFEELGVATMDAQGKTRDMKDVLMDVADKFKNMPAGADRTALAMKLFGKSGAAMLPFLTKGSAGIEELMKQSDALGTTLTGKDLDAVKGYTKAKREWSEAIKGVQVSLGKNLYPVLTSLATKLLPLILPKLQELATHFGDIGPIIDRNWPQIEDTIGKVGAALERTGKWLGFLWDQFNKLPGPVKELIAMLAIAQKTGVLSIAFKGFDLVKTFVQKLAGMTIQAAVVNVNGAGGLGATPDGKKGTLAKIGAKLKEWGGALGGIAASIFASIGGAAGLAGALLGVASAVAVVWDVFDRVKKVITGAMSLTDAWKDTFKKYIPGLLSSVMAGSAGLPMGEIITKGWNNLWNSLKWLKKKLFGAWTWVWNGVAGVINKILADVGGSPRKLYDRGMVLIRALASGFTRNAEGLWNFARNLISSILTRIGTSFESLRARGGQIIDSVLSGISENASGIWNFATNLVGGIVERITSTAQSLYDRGWQIIQSIGAGIIQNADGIWNFATGLVGGIVSRIASTAQSLYDRGWQIIQSIGAGIMQNADGIWNFAVGLVGGIISRIASTAQGLYDRGWQIIQSIGAGIMQNADGIWNFAVGLVGGIVSRIASTAQGLYDRGWQIISTIGSGFMRNADGIWNFSKSIVGNIINNIGSTATALYNVGRNLIVGLYNGIVNMGKVVWNAAARIADNIKNAIKNAFGIRSPSKVTTQYGQMIGQGLADGIASSEGVVNAAWGSLGGLTAQVGVNGRSSSVMPTRRGGGDVHIHVTGNVFGSKEQMARTVVAALQDARNRGLQLDLAR